MSPKENLGKVLCPFCWQNNSFKTSKQMDTTERYSWQGQ